MKNIAIISILFLLASCKKEKIWEHHSELQGHWKEITSESKYNKLGIRSDSRGSIEDCVIDSQGQISCGDIQHRKWRIKNNHLYYGLSRDFGEIMQSPTIAAFDILTGFATNDTIKAGDRYMIVGSKYYVDLEY